MRPIFDIKSQNIPGTSDAPANTSSVVQESVSDHFAPQRESKAMLSVQRVAVPFQGPSPIWWKELQPLIDALPTNFAETDLELSERNKEALRELARSAPHRDFVNS